jgi:nitrogen-specific signal transduction histidine kinase/ActR/RegA family two-component response regulator
MTDSTQKNDDSMIRDPDRFKMISAFAGHIAHEFNNFLTPLTAYPQIIKEALPRGTQNEELLDAIEKTANDMTIVVRQLMSLSLNISQARRILDINAIAEKVVSDVRMWPERQAIEIELHTAKDLAQIRGSEQGIHDAIKILCSNGVEAISGGGLINIITDNIRVETARPSASGLEIAAGSYVRISVSDTGSGVADHVRDRVFEPFVTTRKAAGRRRAGLGLTVAYRIMAEHDGSIDYISAVDKGTTFMLYFPVETLSEQVHDPLPQPTAMIARDKGRVLIADDEKTIQRLFHMILSSTLPDLKIDLASNGAEALDAFGACHHGVVIMDLHMPVMDGQAAFAKIERLCKDRNWEMPPIIFCTGFAPPDFVTNLVAGNPIHCLLSKPVSVQTLVDLVKARLM